MNAKRMTVAIGAVLLLGGAFFAAPGEAQTFFRSSSMAWGQLTWNDVNAWAQYDVPSNNWNTPSLRIPGEDPSNPGQPAPTGTDIVYVQAQVNIPAGATGNPYTVRVLQLYNGINHVNTATSSGWGWNIYPSYRSWLRVYGRIYVVGDLFVSADTLQIEAGGLVDVTGVCFIGMASGYYHPTSVTGDLARRRASEPRLTMNGGRLNVHYGASASNPQMPQLYWGGLIYWPGAYESINAGEIHVDGWFVGSNDTGVSPNRMFDLSNGTAHVYIDGSAYPTSTVALMFCTDFNNASPNLKFNNLTIDRPNGRRIQWNSWVEVHQNFNLLNGYVQGAAAGVVLAFAGNMPGKWTSVGQSNYSNIFTSFNLTAGTTLPKNNRVTIYSTIMVPGWVLDNRNAAFDIQIDDLGAITGSIQILSGRLWISIGTLEVRGLFQVGQTTPPLQSTQIPVFDMLNTGLLWVRGLLGGASHGDFYCQGGATGSVNAGTIRVEGAFVADNALFAMGGTSVLEMTGNVGRLVQAFNNAVPAGKTNATLILQHLTLAKTLNAPGNQVDLLSDVEVRGDLKILSGVLNGASGWTVFLKGQWPVNTGRFTGNAVLEVDTVGRFVLPGGQGPLIRVNKSDAASPGDRCELGGNMGVYGVQVWDGTFDFMGFNLTVTGDFVVGSGNSSNDQNARPTMLMEAARGGGGLDVNAAATADGSFIVYNHSVTTIDSGRIDVDGDFKIDANGFAPGGTNVIRLTGNRGTPVQIWSNKPAAGSMLVVKNFMALKTGTNAGARADMGSPIEVDGVFTMVSGQLNGSLTAPFNATQQLYLKGSPDAWAGTGGSYTNVHNPTQRFQVTVNGLGDQTCFTGTIVSPDVPPDITIDKGPSVLGETVSPAGSVLHGSQVFLADGTVDVKSGSLIASTDLFVGSGVFAQDGPKAPKLRMTDLNGVVESRGDFYFMPGAVEEIENGTMRAHGHFKVVDCSPSAPMFDLFDKGTETSVLEMAGGTGVPSQIFRADRNNASLPLNLMDWTVDKGATGMRVEAYSTIVVNGAFVVRRGTVATPGGVVNIRGNWMTTSGGAYDPSANLALNGSGTVQIVTSQVALPNLRVDKPQSSPAGANAAVIPTGGALSTRNFWVRQGTFRLNGATLTVTGDFTVGGVAVPSNSAATLEISQSSSGGTLVVQSPTGSTGAGNFYFNTGHGETANVNAGWIRVAGKFGVAEPTFRTQGTNVVEVFGNRGSRGELWNAAGTLQLANLMVNKSGTIPGNQVDLISNLELSGWFRMTQGMFNTNNCPLIRVGGDWTVGSGSLFIPTVTAVELTGSAGVPVTVNVESASSPFYDLKIALANAGDRVNYLSTNGRTLQANRSVQVKRGVLGVPAGAVADVGSQASAGFVTVGDRMDATAGGTLEMGAGSRLVMANGATVSVEGNTGNPMAPTGTMKLLGTEGSRVRVTSSAPGSARYDFAVGGVLEAKYYDVISPKGSGLALSNAVSLAGADGRNLSNGAFDWPEAGGTLLNLSGVSSTSRLPLSFRGCRFSNAGGVTAAYNVRANPSWQSWDVVYFLGSTGDWSGETHDFDPGDGAGLQDGYVKWSVGTVDVSVGPANPGTRSVLRQAGSATALQVRLKETSGRQGVEIQTLRFTETGPSGSITSASLYVDADSNGQQGGGDALLGTGTYAGSPARVTFGTAGTKLLDVLTNGVKDLILVYAFSGATPSPSVFQASLAASSDVGGQVTVGSVLLPAEVTGTFPVSGGALTVRDRGVLQVAAGASSPPTGQIIQGMADAPMQQVRVTAGTEEPVNVTSLTLRLTGGNGATSAMLIDARLYEDTNDDGFLNGGETLYGTVASWTAVAPWTATFTGSPLLQVGAGQTKRLLAVCRVRPTGAPGPSGGETFRTSWNAAADAAAAGVTSGTAITAGGTFPLSGNVQTVTLQPSILALAGSANPPTRGIDKAWQRVPMGQVRLVGLGEDIHVTGLTVQNAGTASPGTAVSAAMLVDDANGNGVAETAETVLGTVSPVGATVSFAWSGAGEPVLPANRPVHWLVCYDYTGNGTTGQTLTATVPSGGMTGHGVTTAISGVTGLPLSGGTVTLLEGVGAVVAALGPQTPGATTMSRSAPGKEMAQFTLTAGGNEPLKVMQVRVRGTGTGDESGDVSQAALYKDVDGDGRRTAMDALLSTAAFGGDEGTAAFAGTAGQPLLVLDAGQTVSLLVAYTMSGTASHGETFAVQLESSADVEAWGQTSLALIPATGTFPLQGASMRIVVPGTLSISPGPRNPQNTYETMRSQNLAMLQVAMAASEHEDLRVERMTVHASGTGHDVNHVAAGSVRLFLDVDRNGIWSAPDEEIEPKRYDRYPEKPAGWGTFGSDDGTVTFDRLDEVLTASTTQYWLVVMDLNPSAMLGQTFAVSVATDADVGATGLLSLETGTVSGAPVGGGTKTVGVSGSLSIFPGLNSPPPRNELANAQNLEMAQMALVPSSVESVRVKSLTVSARGTGNAQTDVSQVRLYRDGSGNGLLDASDPLLGTGMFDAAGRVTFSLATNETIPANGEMNYLVVYNLSGSAAGGANFICGIRENTDVSAEGALTWSSIQCSGAPVEGSAMVIGTTGSLLVTYGPHTPGPVYVPAAADGVPILHLAVRATSVEGVNLSSVSIHAGGTGNDASNLEATLFHDLDGNGAVDPGEPVLGTMNRPFDADNGTATIPGINLSLPAGATAYLLLVLNFHIDPAAQWGETYEVRLIPSLDVSSLGATSGNVLYSTGSMIFSSRARVGYPPGYEKYLNLPGGSTGGSCFVATAGAAAGDARGAAAALLALGLLAAALGLARGALARKR
jgi:hypothetical protein